MTIPSMASLDEVGDLRRAVDGAVAHLASAGYTPEAFAALGEAERASPVWSAARGLWETRAAHPEYLLRYARGRTTTRTFPTREAALAAAIEALEMGDGYPAAIETQGLRVMDCAEILRHWEERHDPG